MSGSVIANDVARGFAAYRQQQAQQHLEALRKSLADEISVLQQQIRMQKGKSAAYQVMDMPFSMPYLPTLADIIQEQKTLQAQLERLPTTVNGDVFVVRLARLHY